MRAPKSPCVKTLFWSNVWVYACAACASAVFGLSGASPCWTRTRFISCRSADSLLVAAVAAGAINNAQASAAGTSLCRRGDTALKIAFLTTASLPHSRG